MLLFTTIIFAVGNKKSRPASDGFGIPTQWLPYWFLISCTSLRISCALFFNSSIPFRTRVPAALLLSS
jgi:hypothetical protein